VDAGGRTQFRAQDGGFQLCSQNSRLLHFGLGAATQIDRIVVEWPRGGVEEFLAVAPNQTIRITEGSGLTQFGPITGTVRSGPTPVEKAKVVLKDPATGAKLAVTVTDAAGDYRFSRLALGTYKALVTKEGFLAKSAIVDLDDIDGVDQDFDLTPKP
jgi:hypothetical protein